MSRASAQSADDYLVDTSVWARALQPRVLQRLEAIGGHRLWTCRLVDLEVVYGTHSRDVAQAVAARRGLPSVELPPAAFERALTSAALLASRNLHRHAKPVDLVIAAAAELNGLTVLHYDRDFDNIAKVTRQPVEWVARPGTLDE